MYVLIIIFSFFSPPKATIDPKVYETLNNHQTTDILCVLYSKNDDLKDQTSLLDTKDQKGRYVYNLLRKEANKSQIDILEYLKKNKISHQSFYIINAIHIPHADQALIDYLSHRPEVKRIEYNAPYTYHKPVTEVTDITALETRSMDVQWGIKRIKADTLWSLGITGAGTVIGGEDTGVELHPSLKNNYRGTINTTTLNHNYNWHDAIHSLHPLNGDTTTNEYNNPCGLDTIAPCDDDNHGTHTMGIMAADDKQIGVAPDAKWIACRCMERGWGTPATYIECFEWFLAPTDTAHKNPNPSKAPHVINNSWGCPAQEGCNPSNFNTMLQVIKNLKSAGIMVVASAGNSGRQGCNTINDPAAIFEPSFSVGASNLGDSIADFSSRGPVLSDGSGRIKPNIVAPGVSTLSTIRRGGFASFQGTSMSGPHVAGAVALLISAFPSLAGKVDLLEDILEQTADKKTHRVLCGTDLTTSLPNNTYGYGILNVYAAYQKAKSLISTGIHPDTRLYELKTYPNPTTDYIILESNGDDPIQSILISDASGKQVYQSKNNNSYIHLDLNLPGGIYFYRVLSSKKKFEGKVVIVK